MKIGEVVSASVLGGIEVKLELENPEELKVGHPVIVEGQKYDFYCIVQDIFIPASELIERVAGSKHASTVPLAAHESYAGSLFSSKAKLKPIQLIDKHNKLGEPETIPQYLSQARLANRGDVEKIYRHTSASLPLGNLRGIDFEIPLDFSKLAEKPFALFGRTGMGKSILSKIVCSSMLAKDAASVLIFDMHQEYGVFSKTDNSPGLRYFFPQSVEIFTLDASNKEAKPFLLDPKAIEPSDLIVAFQDLSSSMVDCIYAVSRAKKKGESLLAAIEEADAEELKVHSGALQALRRRVERLNRFGFIQTSSSDAFAQMTALIKAKKSIVLDFGKYGTDTTAYLFMANVIARRMYELYTEKSEELPRLVLFLEEAHKFLAPEIAPHTIFDKLARETRKFNLILALIDQRPSRIHEEVRSQLANRLILSLKEPSDVASALAGVPDRSVWENIVATIPPRTVLVVGDAIRVPTVVEIMRYDTKLKHLFGSGMDASELSELGKNADRVFE